MAKIILAVTGSVAAIRAPTLFQRLRSLDHEVRVVATTAALHFFDPRDIESAAGTDSRCVFDDRDEWPDNRWQRDDPVLHIEFRRWADALVIAPLDAHTLGKIALGLSDNFVTCLVRAWDFSRPMILAPAMNTLMWESPVTRRHFRTLLEDRGDGLEPPSWGLGEVDEIFARHTTGIRVVAPQSKRLACGDEGLGAMAEVDVVAAAIRQSIQRIGT